THPPRQAHSRHPAQDRRQRETRGGIRLATLTCRSDPLAAAAPARLEASYDDHTLGAVTEATERLTRREIERAYATRDTAATMPQTRAASSSQAKNAGSSAAFSKVATAMPPTSSSAPSVTTFASFSPG